MVSRTLLCYAFLLRQVAGQNYAFCTHGITEPEFLADNGVPSVDIIVVQAPLFSTNNAIGQKLGLFELFHTAVVLSQEYNDCSFSSGCRSVRKNYTLEFDYKGGNVLNTIHPKIVGNEMIWDTTMGYCLSEGVLWGREHWTHQFDTVVRLTADQANSVFKDLVLPVNSSAAFKPEYQLWRVVKGGWFGREPRETFMQDITCADGVRWLLHHISAKIGVKPYEGFELKGTAILVDADHLTQVDTSNPHEWNKLLKYYTKVNRMLGNSSILEKIWDAIRLVPAEYVYDTNRKVYYQIHGNHFPWARPRLAVDPLEPPPTADSFRANIPSFETAVVV